MKAAFWSTALLALLWPLPLGPSLCLGDGAPVPPPPRPKAVICSGTADAPATGTLSADLGRPIRLTAKGSLGDTIAWKIIPPSSEAVVLLDAVDKNGIPVLVVFPTDATPFYVQLIAVQAGAFDAALLTVAPTGPKPPPGPEPQPNPTPPGPESRTIPAGHLWVIGVLPSLTQQTDSQGNIERSPRLLKTLDSKGNHFRWVDPACAPTALAPFVSKAQADGLPRVLIVDDSPKDGSLIRASAPLTSEAELIDLVERWGGK